VELIDAQRGRVAKGRRLPDGIQAALEDKEGLERSGHYRVLGATTLQSIARLYPRLAGMTATARGAAEELGGIYRLEVVVVPPHREVARKDYIDLVFTHGGARDAAVLEEIVEVHATGRPVLVGTGSVEESESLAATLLARGVECKVLNARNDEREAEIVAEAGAPSAVTISTRMAGRGTDIRLGGADESRRAEVVASGGLCVLGTRKSESDRADDQLRGRAGRQGDPGSSQLFISLDDDLFARYGVRDLLPAAYRDARSDEPLLDRRVLGEVARAQRIIAARHAAIRKAVWGYDSFVDRQRRAVSSRRRLVLLGRAESRLEAAAPERYRALTSRLGDAVLREVERSLTLAAIDHSWADHLERLAAAREQVLLMTVGLSSPSRFAREGPLATFRRLAEESYETWEREAEERLVSAFLGAEIEERGVDLAALGLAPPARIWTSIVEEQPIDLRPPPRLPVTHLRRLERLLAGKRSPGSATSRD
jgi:preprotein translocase subunit SecA